MPLFILGILSAAAIVTFAQEQTDKTSSDGKAAEEKLVFRGPRTTAPDPAYVAIPYDLRWTADKWEGDDAPYEKMRLEIDQLVAKKPQAIEEFVKKAKEVVEQDKENPLAVFRWAYTGYQWSLLAKDQMERRRRIHVLLPIVRGVTFPYTYNYARMLFLVMAGWQPEDNYRQYLQSGAERLLQKNQNDYDVKVQLVNEVLNPEWSNSKDNELVLRYAQDIVNLKPNAPRSHSILGLVYERIWSKTRNKDDAVNAISAYRQALRLIPLTDKERRRGPQTGVDYILSTQAEYDKEQFKLKQSLSKLP